MTCIRKRFFQLWERQPRQAPRLPVAFCFVPDGQDQWRCFYGRVGRVRRSRVFVNRAAVYGFVSATELGHAGAPLPGVAPAVSSNRFIRCRIIDRIRKPALVPAAHPAVADIPIPAGMAAAGAESTEPISLI